MSEIIDLAIIGSGPAALSAAIYAGRANIKATIFERELIGGELPKIHWIENYPGFEGEGAGLASKMRESAEKFGAKIEYGECTELKKDEGLFNLTIDGKAVQAKNVLVATGTERRKLNVPGEKEAKRVSYCATCDAVLTKGKEVIVVGGANSAVQESFSVLEFCDKVTILVRSELKCDEVLKERIAEEPRIEVITGFTPKEITETTEDITLSSEEGQSFTAAYVFVFIGNHPATDFLPREILAEDDGIIVDDNNETKMRGLFAAGDCVHGAVKQVITAAGAGAKAVTNIKNRLQK